MPSIPTFKILLVGDTLVGKSSLLLRFTDDEFNFDMPTTVGLNFKIKLMSLNGETFKLSLWDTAGQERFMALTPAYYRNAQGVMLVYDVTNASSFSKLDAWLHQIDRYANTDIVKILVGNKIDKEGRQVSTIDGQFYARRHKMLFIETSAKYCENVLIAFEELVYAISQHPSFQPRSSHHIDVTKKHNSCNFCA